MRFVYLFLSSTMTVMLCLTLSTKLLLPAPLGNLLAPQEGIWQNADPINKDFSLTLNDSHLKGKVNVYIDERLVPHVFAEKDEDAYFVQGFIHARFRLWQMELQTLFAAGRLSEVAGEVAVDHDREFRRLGMVYAAENSLKEMEADPETKLACDAYTAGVNAYILSLTNSTLPIEYKLLGYQPEQWSNLKSALFLKYMTYDLSGHENDFGLTNARSYFKKQDFDLLFPVVQDSLDPIIPKGTVYTTPKITPKAPSDADSMYFHFKPDSVTAEESSSPDPSNGSNNWALSGTKTKSGAPMLCNDPHLGLKLPSVWYEMQMSTPGYNAYGVSFPGAPGIIIGYNDNCAFGFTNGGRDVRDYYEINFKDETKSTYWFDSSWKPTNVRVEHIKVKDRPEILDTVAYTIFGPVMYDAAYAGKGKIKNGKSYAVTWTGHLGGNEFKLFYLLNRANNYNDYLEAVKHLQSPGQNVVFACKNGDIALRTQGKFPAKWSGQGDFVMPGSDSSYMWQGYIPEDETPFQYNPLRGFVSSANQRPTDTAYHYFLGREYPMPRGIIINRELNRMNAVTVDNMKSLQCNNYNVLAEFATPLILKNLHWSQLNEQGKKYAGVLSSWNYQYRGGDVAPTLYEVIWKFFYDEVYKDEYAKAPENITMPFSSTLIEAVKRDSAYKFIDNINTTDTVESLPMIMTTAFNKAMIQIDSLEKNNKLKWSLYQDTHIDHLLKLDPFSAKHIFTDGGPNSPNAVKSNHGPSWRMIVHLLPETEAYGIYPGGQNGNPGSKYYDDGIAKWSKGEYYPLWQMKSSETADKRIKWTMKFEHP